LAAVPLFVALGLAWPMQVRAQTLIPFFPTATPALPLGVNEANTALQSAIASGVNVEAAQTNYNKAVEAAAGSNTTPPLTTVPSLTVPSGQAAVILANPGPLTFSGRVNNIGGFFLGTGNTVLPPLLGPTSPASFTFGGLSLTGSNSALQGAAIFNASTATITNSSFENNDSSRVSGGAISNTGSVTVANMTITNSSFSGNTASGNSSSAGGGAISIGGFVGSSGTVTIANSSFSGNTASFGGAIWLLSGTATISNSSFSGNTATLPGFQGGAINTGSTTTTGTVMTIANSSFSGNTGDFGGAIANRAGPATITGGTFTNNTAGSSGGAIYNTTPATITDSTFTNNTAGFQGGAIHNAATAMITGGTFTSNTAGSLGGAIRNTGTVMIANSSFTDNTSSNGGAISNSSGTAEITGGTFINNAAGSLGGAINNTGTATITDSSFAGNTAGENGGAIYGFPGSITILNAMNRNIEVTGNTAGGPGGAIYLDRSALEVNAMGGNITFSGNTDSSGPNAIFMTNEPGIIATAAFDAGAGHTITFLDPIDSNAANGLVTVAKTGPGIVSFDGSQRQNVSNIFANTTVEEGTFEVAHNAVYGVNSAGTSFTVDSGATLQGGVAGTVAANQFTLRDGGTLNIAGRTTPGQPFGVFTIAANTATFQPGSLIKFNTFLGADNSPSDKLVINGGTITGETVLHITNVGGPGAQTTLNGIPLVVAENGATTTSPTPGVAGSGAFTLAGEVRAGAFRDLLFQGGPVNGTDPGIANSWFLRSTMEETPEVTPEQKEGNDELVGPNGKFPVDPPPLDPLSSDPRHDYPIIGPELSTYGVVQPIARQMGLAMLGTLHERIGDTLTIENAGPEVDGCCNWGPSGWARFFGEQIDNHYKSFADPSTTGRMFGVQAGFDIWRGSFIPDHRDAAGLYFAYANSAMDVNGLVTNPTATAYVRSRTGTVNLYGYSGGAYWTHYGPRGWYIDAVVQGTAYTGKAATQFANLPTDGSGIIASLEVGYPIPIPVSFAPRFILEPQGQILWQHTSFRTANDGQGPIGLGSTSGAIGRLGLRAQDTIVAQNGTVWQPYVRANLWQNWGGSATTTFGTDSVPLLQQSTQLEFAAGVTTKVNDLLSFYAQAGYVFGVGGDTDGGRRQGVKGDIGLRLTFCHCRPLPPPVHVAAPAPAAARTYLVFFDWDKATLTDRARQIIREAAANSTQVQYTRIDVNGHTDTSGTPRYNQGLSLRRANAVAAELVRNGVPQNVIAIRGFGQTHLLVPTGPSVREPQNRRVEIIIG